MVVRVVQNACIVSAGIRVQREHMFFPESLTVSMPVACRIRAIWNSIRSKREGFSVIDMMYELTQRGGPVISYREHWKGLNTALAPDKGRSNLSWARTLW